MNNKYEIIITSTFKNELKKIKKRNKNLQNLTLLVNKLANDEELEPKYHDHQLTDSPRIKNCRECHIEPDWLLVYKKNKHELILFLIETGTHSDLF